MQSPKSERQDGVGVLVADLVDFVVFDVFEVFEVLVDLVVLVVLLDFVDFVVMLLEVVFRFASTWSQSGSQKHEF